MEKNSKNLLRNIPNIISGFRICLVAVFAVMFINGRFMPCLAVYITAFLSDVLDGYLARRNNWITSVGKLLVPFADKLMLITALICFTVEGWIPLWVLIVIAAKELTLCVCGLVLYKQNVVVEADITGKIATGLWTCGVASTLLKNLFPQIALISSIILVCAVVASLFALINYAARYVIMPRKTDEQVDKQ